MGRSGAFAIRLTAAALCAVVLGGCDDDCCTVDSFWSQ